MLRRVSNRAATNARVVGPSAAAMQTWMRFCTSIEVPSIAGSILHTGKMKAWAKQVGDAVKADEVICTIDSDKTTVDVRAPKNGTLTKVLVAEGDVVNVGDHIAAMKEGSCDVDVDPTDPSTWPATITPADLCRLLETAKLVKEGTSPRKLMAACSFAVSRFADSDIKFALAILNEVMDRRRGFKEVSAERCLVLFKQYHLICDSSIVSSLIGRWPTIRKEEKYFPFVEFGVDAEKVSLFHGASGQGKTVAAIASVFHPPSKGEVPCAAIYCLARDIDEWLNKDEKDVLADYAVFREQPSQDASQDDMKRSRRDEVVKKAIAKCVGAIFDGVHASDLLRTKEPLVLGLVVDEAGGHPELVRALCSIGSSALFAVNPMFSARVAVAGTGILSGSGPCGSLAKSCQVIHVTGHNEVWRRLTENTDMSVLVKAVEGHPRGRVAVGNSRFARFLFDYLQMCPANIKGADGVVAHSIGGVVNSLLLATALHFKHVNALDGVRNDKLLNLLGFSILMSQRSAYGASSTFHEMASRVIRTYGIVADVKLATPDGPRYEVSTPTCGIMLLLLGLVPRESSLSGESLEEATASLMQVLVSAFGRTPDVVGRVLEAINVDLEPTQRTPPQLDDEADEKAAGLLVSNPEERFAIVSVDCQKAGTGIDQLLVEWQKAANQKEKAAYVVTSGPKYPFADVVVGVPGKALFLIQCKDYFEALPAPMVEEGLLKMGCPNMEKNNTNELLGKIQSHFDVKAAQTVFLFMGRTRDAMALTKTAFSPEHWGGRVEFAAMDSLAQPFKDIIPFIPRAVEPKETRHGEAHDHPLFVSMYGGDKATAALEQFGKWKKKVIPTAST